MAELEWVQNDLYGEVSEMMNRESWPCDKSGGFAGVGTTHMSLSSLFVCVCVKVGTWVVRSGRSRGVSKKRGSRGSSCMCTTGASERRIISCESDSLLCPRMCLFVGLVILGGGDCRKVSVHVVSRCINSAYDLFVVCGHCCLGKSCRSSRQCTCLICGMELPEDDDGTSEVGIDDDTGEIHAVNGLNILAGLMQQRRREREQAERGDAPPGRWRHNVGRAPAEHRTLDSRTLHQRLSARLRQAIEDAPEVGAESDGAHQSDPEAEWLAPGIREALCRLQAVMREEALEGEHEQRHVCALADIHVCHFSGAAGVLQIGESYAHIHGVSCAPTAGTSLTSTPGSIGEVWEYDYDCSSYGDSRYAEWSSSIASTPGDGMDSRPVEWYARCNVWNGVGAYRWTWSPTDESDSESDCNVEKKVTGMIDVVRMISPILARNAICDCIVSVDLCQYWLLCACVLQAKPHRGVGTLGAAGPHDDCPRHEEHGCCLERSRLCIVCDTHDGFGTVTDGFCCLVVSCNYSMRCDDTGNVGPCEDYGEHTLVRSMFNDVHVHVPSETHETCGDCGCVKGRMDCDTINQWCVGGTAGHGLAVKKVSDDGRCMYRSIAVSQGFDESRWKEVVADMLNHMQGGTWDAAMTAGIAERALRHGALPSAYWPTEPHLHAYAQAKGMYLRVWNAAADEGKQWHSYGDEGKCVSLIYNGVNHYDALVREDKLVQDGESRRGEATVTGIVNLCDKEKECGVKRKWCLVTINVSSWKQAVLYLDYVRSGEAGYEPDVLFMQEHRMEGRAGEATVMAQLQRSGYRVAFQSARRAEKSGRACGGTLIAVKARYGIRCEHHELSGHRHVSCVLNGFFLMELSPVESDCFPSIKRLDRLLKRGDPKHCTDAFSLRSKTFGRSSSAPTSTRKLRLSWVVCHNPRIGVFGRAINLRVSVAAFPRLITSLDTAL
eukprot:2332947-Amphidinium_carterae.2